MYWPCLCMICKDRFSGTCVTKLVWYLRTDGLDSVPSPSLLGAWAGACRGSSSVAAIERPYAQSQASKEGGNDQAVVLHSNKHLSSAALWSPIYIRQHVNRWLSNTVERCSVNMRAADARWCRGRTCLPLPRETPSMWAQRQTLSLEINFLPLKGQIPNWISFSPFSHSKSSLKQ